MGPRRSSPPRFGPAWRIPLAVAIGSLVIRIPAFAAARHLGFDDGVYGASARAMRDGAVPFRDVFSSQGPLFLPLVWLADLLGLRQANSPRLLAVAAGVTVTLATFATARLCGAPARRAVLAAALAGGSGSMLWVTGPLTSDGVALALATTTVAFALRYRVRPAIGMAVLIGVMAAATVSVKSLLAGVAVPVVWALWNPAGPAGPVTSAGSVASDGRRRAVHLAGAAGAALAAGIAVTAPFGFGPVWDQSVRYHLDAAGARTPGANAAKAIATLASRDLPVLALAIVVAGITAAGAWRTRRRAPAVGSPSGVGSGDTGGIRLVAGWLAATVMVLLVEHPLWRNHVAHLVPPLAVLIACRLPARRTVGAVLLVTVPWQIAHLGAVLWPAPYHLPARQAVADLASLPAGTWSISDEPGLVWRAGRRTPADLVDTSRLRIEEGRITTESLVRAARDRRVCTVVVWSRRFAGLRGLRGELERAGFAEGRRYDDRRRLYVKHRCQLP